ncbi:glucosyl transferase [Sphaerisporangium krabiense]|uniref:Undecaprenyl-phosphate 4-deoxy-4-formamido-L-arabinose transferase n=1 Tax=Sphaerisporangium krabiense TaxID=763782 RepID=A0A7W8ZAT4_9ACTN|nr:glycosyltransferase family 2 protein [Sphaerisporangium krabiense]MBB5630573.1 undecaprenyl-phosphate 4-deoxy-4-formamido-L-arabinose transferase [Sphaerisporangium krabiense]GII62473.1 glucosyl transferase [Sphaerisporangium krabiense]
MSVSVVVPCYRSARTLPKLLDRLITVLEGISTPYEVILVVDGSPDDTWDVAARLADRFEAVRALHLSRNYGQHNALLAGVREARLEVIVTMDDDLQHPPEQIPLLLAALHGDRLDLVYGVAHEEEHGPLRSLASRSVKAAMAGALDLRTARVISAFRAFRTHLRQGFDGLTGPYASIDVVLPWATTRIGSVRVHMDRRDDGPSTYTLRTLCRHTANMLFGCSALPLRVASYLGFLVGLVGLVLGAAVLWSFAVGATTVAGFTSICSMITLFSSAQLMSIGILGEYVGRIHTSGMGRPTYVIRERTGSGAVASVPPPAGPGGLTRTGSGLSAPDER